MPRDLRALKVFESTSRLLNGGYIEAEPNWYRAVASIPPSYSLARKSMKKFAVPRRERSKPVKLESPDEIRYEEDNLRKKFYRDHPWELARPRILVEQDGKDAIKYDWKTLVQRNRQTDGESVVMRQLWLMHNENATKDEAYKQATGEFYRVRIRQDVEARVALEECRAFGMTFYPTQLQVGTQLEQAAIEKWKVEATAHARLQSNRLSSANEVFI